MEIFENFEEYQNYWETNKFLNEELNYSWATEDLQFNLGYHDSSLPDGAASSTIAPKAVVSERNKRKKLNDKLLALREAVPKISRLDKASIIKDAIEYIQDLQEQERRLQAEIMELESERLKNNPDFEQEIPVLSRSKKTKHDQTYDHRLARSCPVEVHEVGYSLHACSWRA
ncbi:unnamed protein product [Dovyalis caffra]|uniref:BHLH domain-containing protein n=1 Tax=Dovyalis caffra TaxID=77055 RepID=A0AAV1S652_9ROSI|nr:unnamed protein product [Dovyalis caffra]